MKTISSNLKTDIVGGYRANLVKVITIDGSTFGYTDHDFTLIVEGITYVPAPGLSKPSMFMTSSSEVSAHEFASAWIDAPELELLSGKWDNAIIEIRMCSWKDVSLGSLLIDKGNLGTIQWTIDGFNAEMYSHMRKFQQTIGFQVTGSCRHQLFSQFANNKCGACTLNSTSYTSTGTVSATSDKRTGFTTATGLGKSSAYFTNGVLTWTTGLNINKKQEIKSFTVTTTGDWVFFLPAEDDIQVGDTFSVVSGCDKTLTTCSTKFSNVVNFGGFPHIQTEVQYR